MDISNYTPIWLDTYYTTDLDVLEYYIRHTDSGEDIFFGKAYKYPNGENLRINVSRICADYLSTKLPVAFWSSDSEDILIYGSAGEFELYDMDNNVLETYYFYNDYSYDTSLYSSTTFSFPITDKWTPAMYHFSSRFDSVDGDGIYVNWSNDPGDFNYTDGCGDYALYYQNMRTGWDSLLIEGRVDRVDDFSFKEYERENPSSTPHLRGNTRYLNEVQPRWQVNTGWLKAEQAEILAKHLLSSNDVYLHNLKDGVITPVTITDSSAEYKTYLGRKTKKRISYNINLKASNKLVIR